MTVMERAAAVVELLPRPLDPVRSVKLKISILLLASGAAGLAYLYYEYRWQPPVGISLVTVAIVLLTAQVLAHGMTRPLRAMTAAARAMAQGDYSRRVRATSRDEVGQLAVAFNQMAADLAAADQQRRELIANVSHELRTPIAALQAVLENLVDGVATADPATLSHRALADPAAGSTGRRAAGPVADRRGRRGARPRARARWRSWWGRRWRRPRSRRASPLAGWGSPPTSRRGSSRASTATACTRCW